MHLRIQLIHYALFLTALLIAVGCGAQKTEPGSAAAQGPIATAATPESVTAEPAPDLTPEPDPASAEPLPGAKKAKPAAKISQEEFFQAALDGVMEVVQKAIESGAEVNQVDETNNRTALMLAAFNGHTYVADHLILAGAVVDARDQINRTALMFAATGPYVDTVSVLLAAGANVNLADGHENWTPLMFAAAEGQAEVVELLLAEGADPTAVDVDGETSAWFASQSGHSKLADRLKQAAKSAKK